MARHPLLGDLRHRIRIARRSRLPDLEFGYNEQFTLIAEVWAHRTQERAVQWDGDATSEEGASPEFVYTVRRDPLLALPTSKNYVLHEGRRYKILRIREHDQYKRFVGLVCQAEQMDPSAPVAPWTLVTEDGVEIGGEP